MSDTDHAAELRRHARKLGRFGEPVGDLPAVMHQAADELDRLRAALSMWESELGAVMPADFKDWHQNAAAERPAVAAWVIRNLRERLEEAHQALGARS